MDIKKLREYAKEITKEMERRNYSFEDAELLVSVLKNEVSQCKEAELYKDFKALAKD